jgi:hypothetical protein
MRGRIDQSWSVGVGVNDATENKGPYHDDHTTQDHTVIPSHRFEPPTAAGRSTHALVGAKQAVSSPSIPVDIFTVSYETLILSVTNGDSPHMFDWDIHQYFLMGCLIIVAIEFVSAGWQQYGSR